MKLISMTDFVLGQDTDQPSARRLSQIIGYAEFLKQHLKVEMFVPCNDNGNILDDPGLIPSYELEQYRKAKEKVLFKGFTYNSEVESVERIEDGSLWGMDLDELVKYTIEDMIQCDLILTENAIKIIKGE